MGAVQSIQPNGDFCALCRILFHRMHGGSTEERVLNLPSTSTQKPLRIAIIGTGFIADFHARGLANVEGVKLAAVCDANFKAAEAFAAQWNASAHQSLDALLQNEQIDALHVLTPPDTHHAIAKQALERGVHVFLEKPMCVSAAECADLLATAKRRGRTVGVSHSLLFEGAFARLRDHVRAGDLGPLDHVTINHFSELDIIRFGPFNNWMLREPQNTLLERGPHPLSALIDLVGVPERLNVTSDRAVIIPGGRRVYRRWRIHGCAGRTAIDINIDLSPGFHQRTIAIRGLAGTALVDLDANTCVVDRKTPAALDFDRRRRSLRQASQLRMQANATLKDYIFGKAKLSRRAGPFGNSLQDSIAAFYFGLRRGNGVLENGITGEFGKAVIETCERIAEAAKLESRIELPTVAMASKLAPTVLVLGGTGFIGRHLIRQLLEKGYSVRAATRGSSSTLDELGSDRLEVIRGDMRSPSDVEKMLDGIDHVFHLATTNAKTWDQFRDYEIEPTVRFARACLAHGVTRLIYTGTIDSYYAGARAGSITEQSPLDRSIGRRNYYARAKAEVERRLGEIHRKEGLPVVIARPGIVIGEGGKPFHWGVGKWAGESVVQSWGQGTNPLPLVLVDDVARGLVLAMEKPGIDGRSFNFIDVPMLTARDYIAAVQRFAGLRIDLQPTPIWKFFVGDLMKWPIKLLTGHPDGMRVPSYFDWESRTQKATFDCARTREELGWKPISDPEKMVSQGIGGSLAEWLAARA